MIAVLRKLMTLALLPAALASAQMPFAPAGETERVVYRHANLIDGTGTVDGRARRMVTAPRLMRPRAPGLHAAGCRWAVMLAMFQVLITPTATSRSDLRWSPSS